MRILQVTPYFPPDYEFGGPVRLVSALATELAANHNVTVATYRHFLNREYATENSYSVKRFKPTSPTLGRKVNLYHSRSLNAALPQLIQQADVVHTHDYRSFHNITVAKLCKRFNVPLVMSPYGSMNVQTGRSSFKRSFDMLFGNAIRSAVTRYTAVNSFEQADMQNLGIAAKHIAIVPNAVAEPQPHIAVGELRKGIGVEPHQPLITFFSRLDMLKRPDLAVDAFALIHAALPDARLLIFGPDYGALSTIKQHIATHHLESAVILKTESANGGAHVYVDSDLLLLPSPHNEFPLVLLEALSHGLPIVTAEHSIAEQIHGHAGYVTSPTAEKLAQHALQILNDPELQHDFRIAGPQIFQAQFTYQQYVQRIETIYSQVSQA